ncbi:type 1 glutamine amidotransferase [Desulforhopalus sp. IMCC35007]|uniref:type 1 glutamine amidotransferase n=1 Tax=Desulforhopalus sp. IMCC35007 TaxID=2569543 RepID=UPI0010ADBF40|nr:gamma-glutamyl-gamma-aminobutyrate hydrolase family protein [Desulforhopalus sp. IMCC35007]TKB12361.1 amidotransferase [Desulforhopalus sp. IMCC35007]
MRAHYLQHVFFEGLGSIELWLTDAGYELSATRLYESAGFPAPAEIDLLVIMGGPMSVNDEAQFPWLVAEKNFIREVIDSGKPVLGICLGAQLIASAMGGNVYKNSVKEIGWFPVQSCLETDKKEFVFPETVEVFHWHGETFDLPPGATCLASSAGCKNQAFQMGNSVIGLQFHLETTPQSAEAIVAHCRDELVEGQYIQTKEEILAATAVQYDSINRLMADVLKYLHR